jgi:hypothetical protein
MKTEEFQFANTKGRIHAKEDCDGPPCCFHSPSLHPMIEEKMILRTDWGVPLIERLCPHGIGHPDPDSVAWLKKKTGDDSWSIHGCDGCCQPNRVAE